MCVYFNIYDVKILAQKMQKTMTIIFFYYYYNSYIWWHEKKSNINWNDVVNVDRGVTN